MSELTIPEASQKYAIPEKRLAGFCLRNDDDDPLVVDRNEAGEYLIKDDWRLQRLAEQRTADYAFGAL